MKKSLLIYISVLVATLCLFATQASAKDDHVSCKATVTYQNDSHIVRESAKTMDKVKKELIDEACDDVCDKLHGDEEDACEKSCKAEAQITNIECTGNESSDADKKADKKSPQKKYYCHADVSCDGKVFSVKEHAKSKEKTEKKLKEEACERACIQLSGKAEDDCEKSCKKSAVIQKIECKEKIK
ncbi:MAG: hypothetical protein IJ165_03525 [Proteobacteria bacterium]|nr:hypothetical protein [Pseudomonadota bacterium]